MDSYSGKECGETLGVVASARTRLKSAMPQGVPIIFLPHLRTKLGSQELAIGNNPARPCPTRTAKKANRRNTDEDF